MSTDLNEWIDPNKGEAANKTKVTLSIDEAKARILKKDIKPPTSFPIEVFPKEIQDIVKTIKESSNYHTDYTSAGIMSAVATAIGGDMRVYNSKWWDAPILWNCIVGNRGTGKTHPLSWAMKPIEDKEAGIYAAYKEEMQDHEFNEPSKDKPAYLNRVFKDFTIETLAINLQHNEKGLVVFNDELNGWISKMNSPNSSGNEDNWLESFNGSSITVNRVGREPLRVERTNINVLGGIQPSRLSSITSGGRSESGFLDRLLFFYPDISESLEWNDDADVDDAVNDRYASIINGIQSRGYTNFTTLKEDRVNIWKPWYDSNNSKYKDDSASAGLQSKLVTYFWRLALVLEVLKQEVSKEYTTVISKESLLGAIKLVEYFRGTANKVVDFTKSSSEDRLPDSKKMLLYDLPEAQTFTTSEAKNRGADFGMDERAVQRFLKDSEFFTKMGHGQYLRGKNRRSKGQQKDKLMSF